MNPFRIIFLGCFVLGCLAGTASGGASRRNLFFEPYQGHFVTRTRSHSVHIGPASATFSDRISSIRVNMAGANVHADPGTLEKLPATVNYFMGSDPRKWRRGVPTYRRITYKDVYPGIDLTYYGNDGELEFDFVVGPDGLPSRIHLSFDGAERLEIGEAGGLEIHGAGSVLSIRRPVAYQIVDKARRYVETGFDLIGQSEAVVHVDKYDSQLPLIIDPVLVYSTYLGGSRRDAPARIAVDGQGNAYSTGQTFSIDFLAKSPMQLLRGSSDAFVTKVDPDGNLVYSTFIGGDADDEARAISIDTRGNVYLAGSTFSQNFPVGPAITQYGGLGDGFILRLDTSGSLTFSRYLNGDAPDVATGITTDRAGNIYVTGNTRSTNFPVSWFPRGEYDAFIAKFAAAGDLIWGAILGGSSEDTSSDIAVAQSGNVYVMGTTASSDFGTFIPLQTKIGGASDCFVAVANSQGAFIYSTYLGGSGKEVCTALSVDASGITIVGSTESPDFPTARPIQASLRGLANGFVTKLALDGSRYVYSTYFGGTDTDILNDVTSDSAGTIYVAGRTSSTDFPLLNPFQNSNQGASDVVIGKINSAGMLLFSTYFGGGGDDSATGIALDSDLNLLVTGTTLSADFPTQQPFQSSIRGDVDGFITKIPAGQLRPKNDDFKNAIVLDTLSGMTTGTNIGATLEPGETVVGHAGQSSVWWRWTAPFSGSVSFDTIGSDFETVLAVFQGVDFGNLTLVAFDGDSGGRGTSLLSIRATQGVTYQLSVNGFSTGIGNIHLHWQLRAPVISAESVSITGLPPVMTAGEQSAAGVKLAIPYPLPLAGLLTLSFVPDPTVGVDDPAVQFSNGSRSVGFSVPANGTDAIFGDGSMAVTFQSGTVAGTIMTGVLLFTTEADVSPSPQPRKSAVINVAAPTVTDVAITNVTDAGFQVVIDGFSTARSVSSAVFIFVPGTGYSTQTANLTVNVEALFKDWYQRAESKQAGSRFRLVVPFTLAQGNRRSLSAIVVALTNSVGNSAAVTRNFQ